MHGLWSLGSLFATTTRDENTRKYTEEYAVEEYQNTPASINQRQLLPTMLLVIPAFLDGNSYVHYHELSGRFIAGNSDGLIKVFDPELADLEPLSLDILENLTSISSLGANILFTNTEGDLAVLELSDSPTGDETFKVIYKNDFPLRDSTYINEGKRIATGGDADDLIIIDCADDFRVSSIQMPDSVVSVSYNPAGELISVGLANGDIQLVSVVNEKPEFLEKLTKVMHEKQHSSVDIVNFNGQHKHEIVPTKAQWLSNGEFLFVPTKQGTIKSFNRSDLLQKREFRHSQDELISYTVSPSHKFLLTLHKNGSLLVFDTDIGDLVSTLKLGEFEHLPLNVAWNGQIAFVGTTNGELRSIPVAPQEPEEVPLRVRSEVNSLFLDEASESETEEPVEVANGHVPEKRRANGLDDSRIIDEDDEEDEEGDIEKFHNVPVSDYLQHRRKRQKPLHGSEQEEERPIVEPKLFNFKPYTPGSTPWITSLDSTTRRRYLFMNSIGYVWAVRSDTFNDPNSHQSITISFFDRTSNKDYHFIDHYNYDLSSVNERGVLLGNSGYMENGIKNGGHIYYRHHASINDSWERRIPLLRGEYITSLCLTSSALATSNDSIIVVGTNHGYLRFFNLYGLCINLMKVSPVVALISSLISTIFAIHRVEHNNYNYSIIDVSEDYKFLQQGAPITLETTQNAPLIKGIFFNELHDPCVVAGFDDTLMVLSHWREPGNARWVPLLSCGEVVTDYGLTRSKKNWKSWPLGLTDDKFICLILKNNDKYPGFPLSLPLELEVKLPIKSFKHLLGEENKDKDDLDIEDNDHTSKVEKLKEEDPEEEFLRASTLGKLLNLSLPDLEDQDELLERLNGYSMAFDKSLLKLFANACQDLRLNKALSVVKLVKNDKALLAASRIAERFEFMNLAGKITKLREDLHELEDDD